MANTKISALTADTTPTADDLVVTVNDPGGTPATRKATITNFTKAIPAVIGDAGAGGTKGLVPAPAAGDTAAGKFLKADGTFAVPGAGGSPGGSDTHVQFNDSSAFGGDAELTWNKTTNILIAQNVNPGGLDAGNCGTAINYWANVFGTNLNARTKIAFNGQASTNDAIRLDVPNNGSGSNGLGPIRVQENNASTGATFAFTPATPAQITANQNDYAPESDSKYQRWSTDASRNITGWLPHAGITKITGAEHVIVNVGASDIVLKHEDAASTAANRFLNSTGADITLTANQAADVFYDGTVSRWRAFKRN